MQGQKGKAIDQERQVMQADVHESLLIHIGYHKTATTWLQKHLFANPDIGFAMRNGRRRLLKELVMRHPAQFDAETARRKLDRRSFINPEEQVFPVISLERLVGSPHMGGIDSTLTAERLHDLFPQGRVLIVIREQQAMLASTYKQYIRVGGRASLVRYLKPPLTGNTNIPTFRMEHFQYHHLIAFYQTLFGAERVLVLPYELLRQSPHTFISSIINFCGLGEVDQAKLARLSARERTHVSLSAFGTVLKRFLNHIMDVPSRYHTAVPIALRPARRKQILSVLEKLDRMMPARFKKSWDQRQAEAIRAMTKGKFERSNSVTSDLIHIDLADYGYAVQPHP